MRVLGVDPGLGITGYAVIEMQGGSARIVEAGAIRTGAHLPLPERLKLIYSDLCEVIRELTPQTLGLESAFSSARFPRSAIQMAHARGVACLAAANADMRVMDITPSEVKNALMGVGGATKDQIQRSVQALYSLPELPKPADVADAIAIATAVMHRSLRG